LEVAPANSQRCVAQAGAAIPSGIAPMTNRFFYVPRKMRG
jgi:hypothetical protein